MEYLGLFFEVLLFAFAFYVWRLSSGKIISKDPFLKGRLQQLKKEGGSFLYWISVVVMVLMLFNILVHLMQLSKK